MVQRKLPKKFISFGFEDAVFNPRHGSLVTIDIASTVSPETDSIAWWSGEHQVIAIAGNSWYFLMILRNLLFFLF